MKAIVCSMFCAMFVLATANFKIHQHPSTEELIVSSLMKQYGTFRCKDIIPGPVNVTVDLQAVRVDGLRKRILTMLVRNIMEWTDHRLAWENDGFGPAIDAIHIPSDQIWTPDIEIFYPDSPPKSLLSKPPLAFVYPSGYVVLVPVAKVRVFCMSYSEDTEAGTKTCSFSMGSWIYDGSQMNVLAKKPKVDVSHFWINNGWNISHSVVKRKFMKFDCCPDTEYIMLNVTVTLTNDNA